mgnify:CR=1 FL=1
MKHRMVYGELYNPNMPLSRWKEIVEQLIKLFGPEAQMYSDSGSNASQLIVETNTESNLK